MTTAVATDAYARLARLCQNEHRVPALAVAVHRADRPTWTFEVGSSGTDRVLDSATQFRLGSVTKTFTAMLVMQCRDDGLIDLDDRIDAHLHVPAHGDLTIRRLLSHSSGLQREPYGDIWDSGLAPGAGELIGQLDRAERVLANGRRFHYSNLGFSLLGSMVGQVRGGTWAELLADRILVPLGLTSITLDPTERAATGYLVEPYTDHATPEAPMQTNAVAPAGQLWGTATDLARWAGFLADPAVLDPHGAVIASSTVEEMRWPVTPTAEDLWKVGFGLGLMLAPQPTVPAERVVHVGHTGSMPGFLAGVFGRRGGAGRPKALGAAVLGSSGTASALVDLPHALLAAAVEHDPADIEAWTIGSPAPAAYASVVGLWWTEGEPLTFSWRDGQLSCRADDAPAGAPASIFEPINGDLDMLRCVSGSETGERLVLRRDPATGVVDSMSFATYRVSRVQEPFSAA
jgi:CubicO group peptidase (beta-lactamase class C family)